MTTVDGLDVYALSQKPFPAMVEQSSSGMHRSLKIEAWFPTVVEPEVKNLPLHGVDC
jgi:hypothetical protein